MMDFMLFTQGTVAFAKCVSVATANPTNPQLAATCLLQSELFALGLAMALGLGLLTYVLSLITKNDSWVDRLWSIIPVAFAWTYVYHEKQFVCADVCAMLSGQSPLTARCLFAIIISFWGIRLTYNFWRRGGYQWGGEDYRWEEVRSWPVFKNYPIVWQIFSFGFISIFQCLLLWAITIPIITVPPNSPVKIWHTLVAITFTFLLLVETTADQQQWNFQNQKRFVYARRADYAQDYERGFLTHGLFARSRHPNVWAEQNMWITIYCASIITSGFLNATCIGAVVLLILTIRSSVLTEQLSSKKYPKYRQYQKHVPMLVPSAFSAKARRMDALEKKE